ncbi:hypothetical protein CEXT_129671 [Caerostris extrusa]|uniref:Uncharacterized protein n=1 Tax=Caerostris extrusa TaxID=172846 RepID=A0AAV4N162_CAEEX|nr:hypothetical protein CEXT_129671 [Caerostris extrusa]
MQLNNFLITLGGLLTILIGEEDHRTFAKNSNVTISEQLKYDAYTKILISHGVMGTSILMMCLPWICLYHNAPSEFMLDVPFDDSRNMVGPLISIHI